MIRHTIATLWALLLGAIAVLALGAQLDRQSRYDPQLAPLVPSPFRAFSQYHLAVAAASTEDRAAALQEARRLVARRPLPAEHLSLLAQAQMRKDSAGVGLATIQLAAQRGWRDPTAQHARLRLALAAGDGREAGLRLAAIWALARDDAQLRDLAPLVLADENARQALAELLAEEPRWANAVWQRGPRLLEPAIMADLGARTKAARRR